MEKRLVFLKLMAVISYLIMIVLNILSFFNRFNEADTTNGMAKLYPNLITPSGYTFSIWILIYILFAIYVVYQLDLKQRTLKKLSPVIFDRIRIFFIIYCLFEICWLIAWDLNYIALSLIIMMTILLLFTKYNRQISRETLSQSESLIVRLPFSICYAWILFMAISNANTLLLYVNWERMEVAKRILTVTILVVTMVIIVYRAWSNNDIVYSLTILWALTGILVEHISENGFGRQYPEMIITAIVCMAIMVGEIAILLLRLKRENLVR